MKKKLGYSILALLVVCISVQIISVSFLPDVNTAPSAEFTGVEVNVFKEFPMELLDYFEEKFRNNSDGNEETENNTPSGTVSERNVAETETADNQKIVVHTTYVQRYIDVPYESQNAGEIEQDEQSSTPAVNEIVQEKKPPSIDGQYTPTERPAIN